MATGTARHPATFLLAWRVSEALVSEPLIWLDLSRVLAAGAIVWIHCPRSAELSPTTVLARFAVPFFVAAAVFLVFQSAEKQPRRRWGAYAWSRLQRLYVPFLAWSGIYLLFKGGKWILLPDQPNDFPGLELFLFGGAYHLWFLPFLLIVSLVTFAVAGHTVRNPSSRHGWALAGGIAGAIVATIAPSTWLAGRFEACYFMLAALPAALWAWPAALVYQELNARGCELPGSPTRSRDQRPSAALAIVMFAGGVMLLAICCLGLWVLGRTVWLENLAGMALLGSVCVPLGPPLVKRARGLAELSFGVYLAHLLFVKIMEAALTKAGWPATPLTDVGTWIVAVAGAAGVTLGLQQCRATRWMI